MTVVAIVAVLAAILLPALAGARERSRGIYCLNNTRQLTLVWQLYADEHEGALPYNMRMSGSPSPISASTVPASTNNWVNNVMTWDLSSDNTNLATITQASLGSYAADVTGIYHCPSDRVLSAVQRAAGWTQRIRSYSMNAMVGDPGPSLVNGRNVNNPGYRQFLKLDQIPHPTEVFVFLDEHPDSIDDGYFINTDSSGGYSQNSVTINEWMDLPASYHNGGAAISFADGHATMHQWVNASTLAPVVPYEANLPFQVPATASTSEGSDFEWLLDHMSIAN
jgi:prepilin-type processing-associated H-X9-DG protein